MADPKLLIDHLFRHESGKLISVLTRIFGPHNLELAEDVVQDTLLKALDHWKYHGIPENPTAWLFTAARNKALDVIRKERHHKEFATNLSPLLKSEYSASPTLAHLLKDFEIEDEQLRMMFVCCHPSVSEEGQVALILKTLCGLSVTEIAKAFISNEETITKRLYRAREQFRNEKINFELPDTQELNMRLDNVLTSIYLIFNEGYNSTNHDSLIREDLVEESLRLGKMIVDHPLTRQGKSLGLLALMCFQAARLYGRVDTGGNLLQLREQNRSQWNHPLIQQGQFYLQEASRSDDVSSFILEAAIAQEHCIAPSYAETNWKKILQLYDWLYKVKPDALISLNRLIVFAEVHGPQAALTLALPLDDQSLRNYYLYPAALGEWNAQLGKYAEAKSYFEEAIELTQSPSEKQLLLNKISKLAGGAPISKSK